MKRVFTMLTVMLGIASAHAGDYPYLTFQTADGTTKSIEIGNGQAFVFGNGTLTVGGQTFALEGLNKMYFSETAADTHSENGNEDATGIKAMDTTTDSQTGKGDVYDLHGRRIATPKKGIYIKDGKKIVIR